MKSRLLLIISIALLSFPNFNFGQAPNLGTAANFVLFSSVGAVGNTGISHVTGDVGTDNGAITGFGNVNGGMHNSDGATAQCASDLLLAYNELDNAVPTFFPAALLGNGQVLNAGVYSISSPASLDMVLTLDGQNDPNAVFIIQIEGAFATNANSKVKLINGAKACNVFWKIEGMVSMASGTTMRGTVVANNAAITMSAGDTLEGRALSIAGAVTVSGVLAYTPTGCGSPILTGPAAPALGSIECYAIFSSDGPVTNVGVTLVTGDVGTNNGLTIGYNPLFVTGTVHTIPDGSTLAAAADLLNTYTYLNTLPTDITLLYPAQFGNNLVLTPHTYQMNGAATFTDTLYLNAAGNTDAVFVIKINGALSTSTYSRVILTNGTQSKNVFWLVNGAASINDFSNFKGTVVCNSGAINLATGVTIDGRMLTTTGAISSSSITSIMPAGCGSTSSPAVITEPSNQVACVGSSVNFTVVATGTGLSYQWRKGSQILANGGNISGAATAVLTIDPVSLADAASNYNVVVSGTYSPNDTSMNVSLTVQTPPVITSEPMSQTLCAGNSATFSVAATGTGLIYQWRKGTVNLVNGGNISGATSPALTISSTTTADAAANYNVIVSGTCSPNDTSINVSLIVQTPPVITTEPVNQATCTGSSVGFSVTATGTGLVYQWRKGTVNLVNGGNISGATSAALTINPATAIDASSNYNVIVSGTCSPNDTSVNVLLTVYQIPAATTSSNSPVCEGSSIELTAATVAGATYAWTGAGGYSSSAQNPVIPFASPADAGNYSLVVSANGCVSSTSTVTVVVVDCTADLSVTKTVNNPTPLIGQEISFTIQVSNAGPNDATGVVVTDILQSGYTYVSSSATAGSYDPLTGIWLIGALADGQTIQLIVNVTVNPTGEYSNTAVISGNEPDGNTTDNNAAVVPQPTDFHIPEGFSPNNDGTNDLFVIRGIQNYPSNSFMIFNRWGDKVFEATPYENTWDGRSTLGLTLGDEALPVGTYFYILDLGDNSSAIKGTIYLNR